MSYVFTFKKRITKSSSVYTFTGTWTEFETEHPNAIIIAPIEPVE